MKRIIFFMGGIIAVSIILLVIIININIFDSSLPKKVASLDTNKDITDYEISSYITENVRNKVQDVQFAFDAEVDYTPEYLNNTSDNIAIVKVISLEGASTNYNSAVGMTYGKILINTSLYGNLKNGDVVEYLKPGGIVTVADYEKNQPEASNAKREYLRQQSGIVIDKENEYYNLKVEDDIDIEEGKTYLAYLKYSKMLKKYEIIGLKNGLMEINIPKETKSVSKTVLDLNSLEILNNNTKQYESLQEYINKNIK